MGAGHITGGTEIKVFRFTHRTGVIPQDEYADRETAKEAAAGWQDEAPHIKRVAIMFGTQEFGPLRSDIDK